MDIEFKRVDPVEVTKIDKDKQERVLWVKEAMAATTVATKEDLKNLTYEVNPFIKKVEGKIIKKVEGETYWEYDIDKVKEYLDKLKAIEKIEDIANTDWEKKTGAYTVKWIMAVQIALKALWVAPGLTIDWVLATKGNFSGSATVQAIKRFQKENELDATGVPYGPTIQKLLAKLGGVVSGTASESTGNGKDANDKTKPNQTPNQTPPVVLEQQKLSSDAEKFVNDFVDQLKTAKNAKDDILAVEKALRNYLQGKKLSEFKKAGSLKWINGKKYYYGLVNEGLSYMIWTFDTVGNLTDWVAVIFSKEDGKFKQLRIASQQGIEIYPASSVSPETAVNPASSGWNWETQVQKNTDTLQWTSESTAPQNPLNSANIDTQKPTEWKQKEVPGKTEEELTEEVKQFFSQKDLKNPDTTIFDTLAHWNGRDFEELGRVLSKLSLDGLAGKTEALRELMTNLNTIVSILDQNKRFMLFNGAQRKKDVLEQIAGIMRKVWGIPEWELKNYQALGALLQNKKTNTSQSVTPPSAGGALPTIEKY